MSETVERHSFSAEVGRLLDLVVHSLYSDREIFLRELVANAADATDRRRFEALTRPNLALPGNASVRIVPDKDARTILVSDRGIGMSRDELAQNLGTIARSGTRAFGQTLEKAEDKAALIGQFGVGFYAAFMVADRVEVTSRRAGTEAAGTEGAGTDEAWTWASEGQGEFTLQPATRAEAGTDVVLHMKEDATEFLDPFRLQAIVRKWADHITVPITVAEGGEDKPANEGTALWRKSKSELDKDAATSFYRSLGHYFDEPWATLHWRAEGALEYYALLFVPGMPPFGAVEHERESRVRLHVRRMFISDKAELLPAWLRFVEGVVDTEDLPLNVSREMLQATPVLARIRKAVTNRVMGEIKTRSADAEDYAKFWNAFGPVLKEGVWEDAEHRQELAALLRFRSTIGDGLVSLADYVGRMKEGQEAIYFLTGDNADSLRHSPQLEGFRARGVEVLLLSDQVDNFWPERLDNYEGKKLRSVTQDRAALDTLPLETVPDGEPADTEKLVPALKAALEGAVRDVRTTDRLVDSAVVLAAPEWGPDLQMQRLMKRSGRDTGPGLPVLEINPRHKLIRKLTDTVAADGSITEQAAMLLDLARVQDGEPPRDPAAFARRVTEALAN